jgi:hypothetical protein
MYAAYFAELAEGTKGIPGQKHLLEELEDMRKRFVIVPEQIRSADKKHQNDLYKGLVTELRVAQGKFIPIRCMSRAAIYLAAAAVARQKSESDKRLDDWKRLGEKVRGRTVQASYDNTEPFIKSGAERSVEFAKWIGSQIKEDARSVASAVRRALRRAHFLTWMRRILPRLTYLCWSLLFCAVAAELLIMFGYEEVADVLSPYVSASARRPVQILAAIFLVFFVGWVIIDHLLKPRLHRWQERFEMRQIEKFALDTINASFQVRIYQALVAMALFDAVSFAFPKSIPEVRFKFFLDWRVPTIESLDGLAPLHH